jgi:hypothetical protein
MVQEHNRSAAPPCIHPRTTRKDQSSSLQTKQEIHDSCTHPRATTERKTITPITHQLPQIDNGFYNHEDPYRHLQHDQQVRPRNQHITCHHRSPKSEQNTRCCHSTQHTHRRSQRRNNSHTNRTPTKSTGGKERMESRNPPERRQERQHRQYCTQHQKTHKH